ncbi:MAG: hypothetical protein J0L97_00175, partial [Alphaproteobacteria bacterium]|nr:hypothetical protein [Alphaproteobacteria bacterium]
RVYQFHHRGIWMPDDTQQIWGVKNLNQPDYAEDAEILQCNNNLQWQSSKKAYRYLMPFLL